MIYYNSHKINKMYNGTDLVTKMNKTVGDNVDKAIFQYVTDYEEPIDYTKEYLTFEPISSAVSFTHREQQFQYSLDNGNTWSSITSSANTVTVGVGQKMLLKGTFLNNNDDDQNCFVAEGGTWKAYGNLLSLLYGDNFRNVTTLDRSGLLFAFYHCQNLIDISNLTIPISAITVNRGLRGVFRDTGISSAPNNLLPATSLYENCYMGTFEDCVNLVNAPELPAQNIPSYGYYAMFNNCPNLNYVKCLATSKYSNSTTIWLNNVSSTGTFVKKAGASWSSGTAGIPNGWTVIEE